MSEQISEGQVRHVADLARLAVTDEEVARMSGQLNGIAQHFKDMDELDLESVEPTTHAIPVSNVFRPDELRPCLDRDTVLAQAPAVSDHQFLVPRILGDEQ
jgi:aspartyl-tRNA(Asn)/glutamyl-tRNA(Gln) amidotransferase subunit C